MILQVWKKKKSRLFWKQWRVIEMGVPHGRVHGAEIPVLIMDLAPFCNQKCIMCPQGEGTGARGKPMSSALFRKAIDELASYRERRVNAILPFWNGEGTLHPEFADLIEYAAMKSEDRRLFNCFSLHTNASMLDNRMACKILESRLFGPITFSIDAASGETYSKIRTGGDYDRVLYNIMYMIKKRKDLNLQYPSYVFQFIVMKENYQEAEDFVTYWSDILGQFGRPFRVIYDDTGVPFDRDIIFIRRMMAHSDDNEGQLQADRLHREVAEKLGLIPKSDEVSRKNLRIVVADEHRVDEKGCDIYTGRPEPRRPCPGIFQHLGINHEGKMSACCRDFNCLLELGNFNEERLWDVWTGDKLMRLRLDHIEGRFEHIPFCSTCTGQPFGRLEDREVIEYLLSIGRHELVEPFLKRMSSSSG